MNGFRVKTTFCAWKYDLRPTWAIESGNTLFAIHLVITENVIFVTQISDITPIQWSIEWTIYVYANCIKLTDAKLISLLAKV